MNKKLNSLSDLAKIKFEGLVTDQKETIDPDSDFIPQHLEAHSFMVSSIQKCTFSQNMLSKKAELNKEKDIIVELLQSSP